MKKKDEMLIELRIKDIPPINVVNEKDKINIQRLAAWAYKHGTKDALERVRIFKDKFSIDEIMELTQETWDEIEDFERLDNLFCENGKIKKVK